jgi:hypothetical protein
VVVNQVTRLGVVNKLTRLWVVNDAEDIAMLSVDVKAEWEDEAWNLNYEVGVVVDCTRNR